MRYQVRGITVIFVLSLSWFTACSALQPDSLEDQIETVIHNDDQRPLEVEIKDMFLTAVAEEKAWADYLFSKGSIIGLNAELLNTYIAWLANKRASAIRMDKVIDNAPTKNPLPWMTHWTQPSKVQVAPQETEITSYLISSVKRDKVDYSDIEL